MTKITKESLIEYGFKDVSEDTNHYPDLMVKDLISEEWKNENPDEVEDAVLCLAFTCERNVQEFCLHTTDGTLYLGFDSIEHIDMFEKAIGSYSPNY